MELCHFISHSSSIPTLLRSCDGGWRDGKLNVHVKIQKHKTQNLGHNSPFATNIPLISFYNWCISASKLRLWCYHSIYGISSHPINMPHKLSPSTLRSWKKRTLQMLTVQLQTITVLIAFHLNSAGEWGGESLRRQSAMRWKAGVAVGSAFMGKGFFFSLLVSFRFFLFFFFYFTFFSLMVGPFPSSNLLHVWHFLGGWKWVWT